MREIIHGKHGESPELQIQTELRLDPPATLSKNGKAAVGQAEWWNVGSRPNNRPPWCLNNTEG